MCDLLVELIKGINDNIAAAQKVPGPPGVPGKLPVIVAFMPDTVHYGGDCVTHEGALWQARCDTGQAPPHCHWTCLATAGRDGRSLTVRGTFDKTAEYRNLDVVALNGGSFVALRDAPGPCPGPGWQLLTSLGKRGAAGETGERGERGPRGEPGLIGATIRAWKIDRARYCATPLMSDSSEGPPLQLRELFEQFLTDAS